MSTGVGKHKMLSLGPTEPWSVREKLCLASSVMRSGDQNWVSVSRAIKPFSEPGRPPDWFSQKHCASQYSELLETTEAPKRKRGEKGEVVETIEDVIVRRLTAERIDELKRLLKDTQEKYRKLKKEADLIQAGHMDPRLDELWGEIEQLPSVTVRSPLGAGSPSMELPHPDTPQPTPDETSCPSPMVSTCMHVCVSVTGLFDCPSHHVCFSWPGTGCVTMQRPWLITSRIQREPSPLFSIVCVCVGAAVAECSAPEAVLAVQSGSAETEGRETELVEEDLVAVSYMGEELDLETVGDIIAIIEEKVDDPVEVLDVAEVEAALSLCDDAVAGPHALSGPWEPEAFKAAEPEPSAQPRGPSGTPLSSPVPGHVDSVAPAEAGQTQECELQGEEEREGDEEGGREEDQAPSPSLKCESEEWTQPEADAPCLDSEDSSVSGRDPKEVKDEDGGSEVDADEGMEMKECGEGPYLSEVDPPASESEDGYGTNSQRYTTADSTASSPASSQFSMCSEDQEALQAQKIWKKAIMLVWRAAANHRYASVFLQPVSDDIAPGYHSIVHRPMDLSAIKKNIETGQIRTTAEFQRDIMLMFQNAVMYNSSDHDVYHMALEMQRDVLEQIQQFLATQLIMQTSESGISAKSLRGREANRKQDANDKDSVPMASPAFLLSLFDGGTRGRRSAIEADMKMKK
uniref:Bromodomain-containing protein 8 n=1 Tax=Electrophorus electricus TaxID=8005 RepID=A0A4W4FY87_ELEEL